MLNTVRMSLPLSVLKQKTSSHDLTNEDIVAVGRKPPMSTFGQFHFFSQIDTIGHSHVGLLFLEIINQS